MTDRDQTPASAQSSAHGREPKKANKRGSARLAAVQALYQMDIGGTTMEETLADFSATRLGTEIEGDQYLPADADFFGQIVRGVVAGQRTIDPMIDTALTVDWPVTRIDATLRAILRAGVFELLKRPDIPAKVVISEYLDISRAFFEDEGTGLVNAVLDTISRRLADDRGQKSQAE